ncbi:MAG: LacI family DNA-binding transcriptional regulator [Bacteroidaceae bacterium]|nr:LacI family DNA-binding transcriptional regulator [Bacteroidaceae bacterium]
MKTPQITIRDIAKALGISVSTVSRALHDSPEISTERRKAIKEYARKHHYTPNLIASSLRASRNHNSHIIGVVVPKILHYYFADVLAGIEEKATEMGYRIMVSQSNEEYAKEKQIIEAFEEARVCGVIISQAEDTRDYDHFRRLIDKEIPLIFYDRICTGIQTPRVVIDDYAGAYTAVEYLVRTGCRRIGFMGSAMNLEISKNRLNGYKDALLKKGLRPEADLTIDFDQAGDSDEKQALIDRLLNSEERPDALFANNDVIGTQVLNACKRAGLRVPDDVSIVCFTNSSMTRVCDPQLTCVDQRGNLVGRSAAELLIDRLEGRLDNSRQNNRIIKTNLIVRASTLPLRE